MLAHLAGDTLELEAGIAASPDADVAAGTSDTGDFMTARRVRSWAELVCSDTGPRSFSLYVTSSPAVLEHLLDLFEQAQGPLQACLDTGDIGGGHETPKVIEALERLSSAENPLSVSADCFRDGGDASDSASLTIYTLPGISPQDFPHRLLAGCDRTEPGPIPVRGALNTLIGLMEK